MASLFKPTRPYPVPANASIVPVEGKPHVEVKEGRKLVRYPLSEDGTHYLKPGKKWAADVRHANGKRKRVRFSANHDAAALMLADLLKKIEREKAGEVDRCAVHRVRALAAHLEEWKASLAACGRDDEYIAQKSGRVRTAFDGCGFVLVRDLSADRLESFLLDLRVKENRTIQTANDWLQAIRQFCRWMVANERMERDPFARLKPGNPKLDQRRRRGEFTPAEIGKLLIAAEESPDSFRGLVGTDRRMLYRVALGTGFRAAELSALVPDFFDLDADTPSVILPAEFTKNRKGAVQPIGSDLADELRNYLSGRTGKGKLWPGTWADRSADMLKLDLTTAGVPLEVEGPEGVEVRDFHALRNCYISDVLRTGADLKQAMTLARHSDPRLTTARYGRTRLHDLGSVVNKLPSPASPATTKPVDLRMTGTDGNPNREQQGAAPGAAAGGSGRVRLKTGEDDADSEGSIAEKNKPLRLQGFEDDQGPSKTIKAERAGFSERWLTAESLACSSHDFSRIGKQFNLSCVLVRCNPRHCTRHKSATNR